MYTPLLNLLSISLKKVVNNVIRDFNEIEFLLHTPSKALSFALSTNIKVQNTVYEDLSKYKNTYGVIFKNLKTLENKDKSNYFLVNGIIGINNFSRGLPSFCLCIALVRDNQIFATVIANPITNETFYAEKGIGSFYNKKKLKLPTNKIEIDNTSIIATDYTSLVKLPQIIGTPQISNCKTMDICHLALGKVNLCSYKDTTSYYNLAPAILVANEAGINFNMETTTTDKNEKIITSLENIV